VGSEMCIRDRDIKPLRRDYIRDVVQQVRDLIYWQRSRYRLTSTNLADGVRRCVHKRFKKFFDVLRKSSN